MRMNAWKGIVLAALVTVAGRGAEYLSDTNFASFPTPAAGSYYNTGTTNTYGPWRVNRTGAAGSIDVYPYPVGTIDIVSPSNEIVPPGSPNPVIDPCGLFGPSTLYQSGTNFQVGTNYVVRIVTEASESVQWGATFSLYLYGRAASLISVDSPCHDLGLVLFTGSTKKVPVETSGTQPNVVLVNAPPITTFEAVTTRSFPAGHPATNTVVTVTVPTPITNVWYTNAYTFTASATNWTLYLLGVGTHRGRLIRSVSIQDQ